MGFPIDFYFRLKSVFISDSMKQDLNYGVGALITITISIGIAAIAYGGGYIPFDLSNLPAWIFGPLGVYTLLTSLFRRPEVFYNLGWSLVFLAITVISAFYKLVNMFVVIGILLIAFGVVSSIAYLKKQKKEEKT